MIDDALELGRDDASRAHVLADALVRVLSALGSASVEHGKEDRDHGADRRALNESNMGLMLAVRSLSRERLKDAVAWFVEQVANLARATRPTANDPGILAAALIARGGELLDALREGGAATPTAGAPASKNGAHAPDFKWLWGCGRKYIFKTHLQRLIIKSLYREWSRAGDGAPKTASRIADEIAEETDRAADVLRVDHRFDGHPALGTILRRAPGKEAAWALHLQAPEEPAEGQQADR